jgi:hypothetical protein
MAAQLDDTRTRAWLAAALLPELGVVPRPSLSAASEAVGRLLAACASPTRGFSGCDDAAPTSSVPATAGAAGPRCSIAQGIALRRWRLRGTWSQSSSGSGGCGLGGSPPWRGAASTHTSCEDHLVAAQCGDADVLTLI